MGKLLDKIRSTKVGLVGNRIALASHLTLALSYGLLNYTTNHHFGDYKTHPRANVNNIERKTGEYTDMTIDIFCFFPISLSVFGEIFTVAGLGTQVAYKKTRDSIRRHGKLDPRFIEKYCNDSEIGCAIGYCQLQGMYLAAKEAGELDAFYQIRNKMPNRVPHF